MNRWIRLVAKNYKLFSVGVIMMVLAIVLDMFDPYLKMIIVDEVIKGGKMELFKGALLGLVGITVGRAIFGYIKELSFDLAGSKVVALLRQELFEHIQKQSFDYFDSVNTGELMSRVKDDGDNVLHASAFGAMLFSEQVIYFVIASTMLLRLNWKLALICLSIMPFIAFIGLKLEKFMGECYDKISDQRASMNTTAQENIAGVRLVKSFGRERHEIIKFLEKNKKYFELNVEQADILARYNPVIEFLSNTVLLLVTVGGGYFVIGGDMSVGGLVAFSSYIYMLIWPMRMLGWLSNVLAQCKASLKKIDGIFEAQPTINSSNEPKVISKSNGALEFKNVSFSYNNKEVLKDINIKVKPGNTLAIMGATGSGKTTLINLIGRYYDCTKGSVCFDGIDVKRMSLEQLRSNISMVMQETFLFSDSIKENITFGDKSITEEDMNKAAKNAKASEFILKMHDKFDSVIGERGTGLSGGQKQRVSIARAFAKNARVLILDDSTSALDMETEHEIQKSLEQKRDATKIIVAHRISAVKNADEIIILDKGRIVERGTHEELLSKKGMYYDTYVEQYKGRMIYDDEIVEEVV